MMRIGNSNAQSLISEELHRLPTLQAATVQPAWDLGRIKAATHASDASYSPSYASITGTGYDDEGPASGGESGGTVGSVINDVFDDAVRSSDPGDGPRGGDEKGDRLGQFDNLENIVTEDDS